MESSFTLATEPNFVARFRSQFTALYGSNPDGVWSAPGRVNLIGEHTDYNEGLCLPLALPHRTYVALARRPDTTIRFTSRQRPDAAWTADLADLHPSSMTGWVAYAGGVVWEALEILRTTFGRSSPTPLGFDLLIDSTVPTGSGLSSSAALEAAVALAMNDVFGLNLADSAVGRQHLIDACIRAEHQIAGVATGGMDQTIAFLAQQDHAMLLDFKSHVHQHMELGLEERKARLLIINTAVSHALTDGPYDERRHACTAASSILGKDSLRDISMAGLEDALATLARAPHSDLHPFDSATLQRRVRHVVTENARVSEFIDSIQYASSRDLGTLMTASHTSLRDDFEVSSPELDLAVEIALQSGAHGARMTGGGFGGCALALVPAESSNQIAEAVSRVFADQGFITPRFLHATPSSAAATEWLSQQQESRVG